MSKHRTTQNSSVQFKRKPLITALEPRILLDGAAVATGAEALTDVAYDDAVDTQNQPDALAPVQVQAAEPSLNNGRKEVAFVDGSVNDYETLVAGIKPGIEVYVLNGASDGISQIQRWAQQNGGYDAIHILSHGSDNQIRIGKSLLSSDNVDQYSESLQMIGAALEDTGDLLFYGCNIAESGQDLIDRIAQLSNADVAASSDYTGSESLGGDWELEAFTGEIEASEVIEQSDSEFNGLLESTTYTFDNISSHNEIDWSFSNPVYLSFTMDDLTVGAGDDFGWIEVAPTGDTQYVDRHFDEDGEAGSDKLLYFGGAGVGNAGNPRYVEFSKTDGSTFTPQSVEIEVFTYRSYSSPPSEPFTDTLEVFGYDSSGNEVGYIKYDPIYDDDYLTLDFSNITTNDYVRNNGYYTSAPTLTTTGSFSDIAKVRFKVGANNVYLDNLVLSTVTLNAPVFEGDLSDSTETISLNENSTNGTSVIDINANDGDGGATDGGLTYSIIAGNTDGDNDGNLPFTINSTTGVISVNDSGDLDFEDGTQSYNLTVRVDDSGASNNTADATVTVNISDVGTGDSFDYESIANNGTSFSAASQTFALTGNMVGQTYADYGSNLIGENGNSDAYMDSGVNQSRTGNIGGIAAPNGYAFKAMMFDVWPSSTQGGSVMSPGETITVIGKLNGQQVVTADVATFSYGQSPIAIGGAWQRIDLTGTDFLSTEIDTVEFVLSRINELSCR